MREILRVLVGSCAMVYDSASTSKVKDAAARYPSGQLTGGGSGKAGNPWSDPF